MPTPASKTQKHDTKSDIVKNDTKTDTQATLLKTNTQGRIGYDVLATHQNP